MADRVEGAARLGLVGGNPRAERTSVN